MEKEELIPVDVFCAHHQIEVTFVRSLQQAGLIELVTHEEVTYIDPDRVRQLEKYVRLHYDLEINMEGLEAITHLLNRVENMQEQIRTLRNRLNFYEGDEEDNDIS